MYKILILFIALILASCNNSGCYEETDVKVVCSFFYPEQNSKVEIDSVSVWGVGSDSLIYKNKALKTIELKLNPKATQTDFVFQAVANGYVFRDTLSFIHSNHPWFQSMECGAMMFNTIDTCLTTGRIFRSVEITEPEVTNYAKENIIFNL